MQTCPAFFYSSTWHSEWALWQYTSKCLACFFCVLCSDTCKSASARAQRRCLPLPLCGATREQDEGQERFSIAQKGVFTVIYRSSQSHQAQQGAGSNIVLYTRISTPPFAVYSAVALHWSHMRGQVRSHTLHTSTCWYMDRYSRPCCR